jgi:regulator of RNase E activity RraA
MSARAKNLCAEGVVIDGRFRGVNKHRQLNMGLFARDVSILGSNTFTRSSEIDVPVDYSIDEIEGARLVVQPGDVIVGDGDADGVVSVPAEAVANCVGLCQERWEIDQKTLEGLKSGEEMGPMIKKLRKRA